MADTLPAHSPLGASGAERWMACLGSVTLLKRMDLPESDEAEYRRDGVAAHDGAAKCLTLSLDAWEIMGEEFNGTPFTEEMAGAVQTYIDVVKADVTPGALVFTELKLSQPGVHKDMFGTLDRAVIHEDESWMIVTDYKHGEGIQVDADDNPQLKYYAFMLLLEYPHIRKVKLRIVQPRGFHQLGPVREWPDGDEWLPSDTIVDWAMNELVPAMNATAVDNTLDSGPWCRFCPAKLICPMLSSLFKAAATYNPQHIVNLSNEHLGRSYQYLQAVKFYVKALEDETFRRSNLGQSVPGTKLVLKKANRVWNTEAPAIMKARFGDDALTKPELKSPAEIEKLSAQAKALVKEYAYTPQNGLTIALEQDKRVAVKVETVKEAFAGTVAALTEAAQA